MSAGESSMAGVARTAARVEAPQWYACYTRSRHEKKIKHLLEERGIGSYLPLVHRIHQWKDRRKEVSLAMFPSYVFARCSLEELPRVSGLPGVVAIVRRNGAPAPIAAEEMENVRRFAEAAGSLDQQPRIAPLPTEGTPVRIAEGPFAGVDATVIEHRGRARVLVALDAIGKGLEVDIDASILRAHPIARPAR